MDRWVGKTAVVTGASAGIGAAICVQLANSGLRVVGLARRPQLIDELKSQVTGSGSINALQCDVSKVEEIEATFRVIDEQYGAIHVLINNAGVAYKGQTTDLGDLSLSLEQIASTIDINLRALILCTRLGVASMNKHKFDGHIIQMNSILGHIVPHAPYFNVYTATKHGVTAFSESLRNELAALRRNIKVTSISPGFVSTDMTEKHENTIKIPKLKASDVADAVCYVLFTPDYVNITELTLSHTAELRM